MNGNEVEVKLVRLHDIVLHHMKEHEGTAIGQTKLGQMNDLEHDICVWVKNFLMTCEELSVKADVTFVGDNHEEKGAIVC